MRASRDEDGSASLWVLALGAVLVAATLLGVVGVSAVLARHRLEHTADLAALAAARTIGTGPDPCQAADRLARAGSGRLIACTLVLAESGRAGTVEIELARPIALPLARTRSVHARARAARLAAPTRSPTGSGVGSVQIVLRRRSGAPGG